MQLEAGKKYVDRRGRIYGPLFLTGTYYGETAGSKIWHHNGGMSAMSQHEGDLIAEHVEFVGCSHWVTPIQEIVFTVGGAGGAVARDSDEDFVSERDYMIYTNDAKHVLRPGVDSVWNGNAWIPYTGEKTCLGMTTYARARFAKSAAPVALPRDINYIPRYADGWSPEIEVSDDAIHMIGIIFDSRSTPEERERAASTLVEAVYPELLARKQ